MADCWGSKTVANEVNFTVAVPTSGQTLRKSINLFKVLFDLAEITWFVKRLETLMVHVKMVFAVDDTR